MNNQFNADNFHQLCDKLAREDKDLKLKDHIGLITPKKLAALTDAEMRSCYFSRQKIIYTKGLAEVIIKKQLSLKKLSELSDEEVRDVLKRKELKQFSKFTLKDKVTEIAQQWKPHRSIATMMLWHYYIQSNKNK